MTSSSVMLEFPNLVSQIELLSDTKVKDKYYVIESFLLQHKQFIATFFTYTFYPSITLKVLLLSCNPVVQAAWLSKW